MLSDLLQQYEKNIEKLQETFWAKTTVQNTNEHCKYHLNGSIENLGEKMQSVN